MNRIRAVLAACAITLLGTGTAAAVPDIQFWNTDQGARVMFVKTDSLPMVDVRVVFAAGSARDGEHPGLAMLTNGLLSSGAGDWNADQIAQRLEQVGAVMNNELARDMAYVSLRSLTDADKLNAATAVLREVLADPHFDKDDLDRDRKRLQAMIRYKEQQPGEMVDEAFYKALYGDHPYAHPPEGTIESVAAITAEQLHAFHERYYVARNAVVAIVGAMDRSEAGALAESLIESLPAGKPAPALPKVTAPVEAVERRIPMPTTQTHIAMGQPAVYRGDPDYFPLYVGNHVLGGSGFSSRVMQVIREDRGLAYDAHSYFVAMDAAGPFRAGLQTRNEQAGQATELLRETINDFIEKGPTEDELERAKKNITGSFPLNLDSNSDLLGYIAMIGFYDLPLNYLNTFTDRVRAVGVEDVRDAFERRIHPEHFVEVTVGGAAQE